MPSEEIFFSSDSLIELIKSAFARNAFFRFEAKGFSMFIFIKDGDVATLSPPSVNPITLGKAIGFLVQDQVLRMRSMAPEVDPVFYEAGIEGIVG